MKIKLCILGLTLVASHPALATLYQYGTLAGGSALGGIPDNSTIGTSEMVGTSFVAGGLGSSISDLTLKFVLQGGASTDLSGYLRLGTTTSSPYYDLTSLIHASPEVSGGTTYTLTYATATFGSDFQTALNGRNPNDTWTLYFQDTVGSDTTTLNGWSLEVTAVPEPVNVALGVFGVALVGTVGIRRFQQTRKVAAL